MPTEPPSIPAPPDPHPSAPPLPSPAAPGLGDPHHLDPRALPCERVSSLITSAVILGAALFALALDLIFGWWDWPVRLAAWCAVALIAALLAWSSFVWTRLAHRAVTYRYGPAGIEIRRGVWWRTVLNVPASRVQHTDVTQGPLLRRYGLAALTVHTAATKTPSVSLPGLAHADALALRDLLTSVGGGDGV